MAGKKKTKRDTSNWEPDVKARPLTEAEEEDRQLFGIVLGEIRVSRKLTQNQLAELLGTSRSQIDRMTRDGIDPRLSVARRCAKALNVPLWRFWDGRPSDIGKGPTPEQWQFLDLFEQLTKDDRELIVAFLTTLLTLQAERLGIK